MVPYCILSEAAAKERLAEGYCWKCCRTYSTTEIGLCDECYEELRDG